MLKLFLWLRYLRKKKIVFLSIAAVALAVSMLTTVASLFNGFIDALRQASVETIGDVVLTAPIKFAFEIPDNNSINQTKEIALSNNLIECLEELTAVEAATATLSSQGLLHLGKGNVRAVSIWGVEPGRRARVTGFKQSLIKQGKLSGEPSFEVSGFPERIGGFLGIGVVAEPNERTDEYDFDAVRQMIGQRVVLTTGAISRAEEQEGAGVQVKRKVLQFTVVDVVFTGVYELDKSFIYLPIEELQNKLYPDEEGRIANQIQIKLSKPSQKDFALAQIRGVWRIFADERLNWSPYLINETTITTAEEMQIQYVTELRKQMRVLLFIFGVVDCSAVVLIFCIFYMIVITKQRDIAIIKSCGASSSSVAFIFVGFGACVGITGAIFGTAAGYLITKNINTIEEWIRIIFGLKLWKSSVYMFSKIPNEISWESAFPIVFFAVAAASAGALIPAIVASRTKPVEILRYE